MDAEREALNRGTLGAQSKYRPKYEGESRQWAKDKGEGKEDLLCQMTCSS